MFRNASTRKLKRQWGLSLVELMVSMAIGAVIISGAVVVYMDQLQSSRRLLAVAQLQESGRVALDIMERDIRMAGFTGCFSNYLDSDNKTARYNSVLSGSTPATFQPETGIQGWEASGTGIGDQINNVIPGVAVVSNSSGWLTAAGSQLSNFNVVPGSDILRIWAGGDVDFPVTAISSATPPEVTVEGTGIENSEFLLLGDCSSVDIVQACNVSISGSNSVITLGTGCSPGNKAVPTLRTILAETPTLTTLRGITYAIRKQNDSASNPPSLFRAELNNTGATLGDFQEVVQGVESMQILYGIVDDQESNTSVDAYVTANNVPDWADVVSVQVSLLMQSVDDNLAPGPVPYVYNGKDYSGALAPDDRRLRRVFSRTITLRNRVLGVVR